MSKNIFIPLIIISLIFFGFLFFKKATASTADNVWGWAWANFTSVELEGVGGWISFNSTNTGATVDYGVHICESDADPLCGGLSAPRAGKIIGEAWAGGVDPSVASGTVGWISFDRNETGDPPGPPYNGSEDFIAKVDDVDPNICDTDSNGFLDDQCGGDNSNTDIGDYKQVFGWARVLAGNPPVGGWSGWIKLSGGTSQKYGVTIDMTASPKEFHGWAWGGGGTATSSAVVGWISFNTANYGGVSDSDYKVLTSFTLNTSPTVSNTSTELWACCGLAGKVKYRLKWTYNDADGNPMSKYDIKVLDLAGNLVYSTSITGSWGSPPTDHEFLVTVPDNLHFGVTYRWYVNVYDSEGADSGWVYGGQFTTPSHAYPWPDFAPQPSKPSVGEIVTFIQDGTDPDNTKALCYSGGTEHLCQEDPIAAYFWDFGNGQTSSYKGNATTTYASKGDYDVLLAITDDVGTCTTTKTVTLSLPLPKWKEIKP